MQWVIIRSFLHVFTSFETSSKRKCLTYKLHSIAYEKNSARCGVVSLVQWSRWCDSLCPSFMCASTTSNHVRSNPFDTFEWLFKPINWFMPRFSGRKNRKLVTHNDRLYLETAQGPSWFTSRRNPCQLHFIVSRSMIESLKPSLPFLFGAVLKQWCPLQVLMNEENITEVTAEVEGPGTNVALYVFCVSLTRVNDSGHAVPWRNIQSEANSPLWLPWSSTKRFLGPSKIFVAGADSASSIQASSSQKSFIQTSASRVERFAWTHWKKIGSRVIVCVMCWWWFAAFSLSHFQNLLLMKRPQDYC